MTKNKHVPMRKCIGCNTSFDKRELIRLANADGIAVIDGEGNLSGRGAYLCKDMDCLEKAIKRKAFARAMGVNMTTENAESLRREYKDYAENSEVSE
ncbi:MAG: YlxR family protein [Clostridiales Family XIII bacterium]|nr:YlxR family protein [Clostridiales Family XIII bacterium]